MPYTECNIADYGCRME